MTTAAAELETEMRRLRVRIISLTTAQLDEAAPPSPSRRAAIREALAEFSAIGSEDRPVPELGDQTLADQVVVLLEHGLRSARALPESDREHRISTLTEAAVRLRRNLA
ncbi:hypothetical protein BI49514_01168 [Brevibacterium iodinum ATCC 49514]|uniref:Uncharacterized protein n=1 Tax=Brevibacterium iodinum ATCC 49514 TaxID=1255616 RepID=A0A2H1IP44_9MICO|nr:hypothetical protein [Brevibacterium iodinum]SMX76979.1 hypothetical protein BI49514_01168 [Brevibacterium iodinum ATCC 49514]SUW11781.1 Uncharacterised protein [Brevibacterium iodinum]